MALIGLLAFANSPTADTLDAETVASFTQLKGTSALGAIEAVGAVGSPVISVSTAIALLLIAAITGQRGARVIAASVLLVGANLSTQVLQLAGSGSRLHEILSRQQPTDAQWPSGHATAAMTLVLVAVVIAPPAWRVTLAAAGSAYALAVGVAVVALGRHFPSDVAGAFMVAGTWGLVTMPSTAFAKSPAARRRWLRTARRVAASSATVVALTLLIASWVTFDRLGFAWEYARLHQHLVAGLLVLACLTILTTAATVASSECHSSTDPTGRQRRGARA